MTKRARVFLAGAAVAALVGLVYLPVLSYEFVSWDDATIIANNQQIRSLAPANLAAIFGSFHFGLYHPLVTFSHALEYRFFGLNPLVYHLDNLLLHLINSGLVLPLALALGWRLPAAAGLALLFGLHPAHVESVAWAMERKDMLYAAFYLAALLSYIKYLKAGGRRWLAASFFLFFASLLSKAAAVSFPFVLLALDYYFKGKADRTAWRAKLPFFCLAALGGALALLARQFTGGLTHDPPFSAYNVVIGAYRLLFYFLPRIVFPWFDPPLYPGVSFSQKAFSGLPPLYWLAPLLLCALVYLFCRLTRERRALFGGLFFLLTLLPSCFLISVGPAADRFTYLPALGVFFWLAALLPWNRLTGALFVLLIIALLPLTLRQEAVWRNSLTLWDSVVRRYPAAAEAWNMRGLAHAENLRLKEALADFDRALRLKPDFAIARANRGAGLQLMRQLAGRRPAVLR
ncbi:MAG: tetratricopeptide repeat protein [Candidatus Saganbacteria bacterium]|nr:tetratricopeptide repeat protein [Candidatus Saganbacteria bacterium]